MFNKQFCLANMEATYKCLYSADGRALIVEESRDSAFQRIKQLRNQQIMKARIVYDFKNVGQLLQELGCPTLAKCASEYLVFPLTECNKTITIVYNNLEIVWNQKALFLKEEELCQTCFTEGNVHIVENCCLHKRKRALELSSLQDTDYNTKQRRTTKVDRIPGGRKCECSKHIPCFGLPSDAYARWCLKCPNRDPLSINIRSSKCQCGLSQPTFGLQGEAKARWCMKCPNRDLLSINVRCSKCECGLSQPSFGMAGDSKARWCVKCPSKTPLAVDIISKRCECGRAVPHYGLPNTKRALWCKDCPSRDPLSNNIVSKMCECGHAQASLALKSDKKKRWCAKCPNRDPEAIDISHKKCECGKATPSYGIVGEKTRKWCKNCPSRDPLAVNTKARKCECGKAQPSFALLGETKAKWCSVCPLKDPLAINVLMKRCECGKTYPSFGLPGETEAYWCSKCKPPTAINMKSQKCECGKSFASFGLASDKKKLWCFECTTKHSNAIILNRKCFCGKSQCTFGLPNQIKTHCFKCKTAGMIRNPKLKCEFDRCYQLASYGMRKRERCELHKQDGDFNLLESECVSCGLMNVLDDQKRCIYCNPENFKNFKLRKEHEVVMFLRAQGLIFEHDCIPNTSKCGKERPDIVIECGTHNIIVEIDEDQHSGYNCACEQTRMVNVTQTFGGLPCFWIRYNPDKFCIAKRPTEVQQSKRMSILYDWIKTVQTRQMSQLAEIVYLFFDDCATLTYASEIVVLPSN